jgi:hypothetical protein
MSPGEIPIELNHVPGRLRTDFTTRLPEATSGSQVEREVNFLSRALAAFAVYKLAGCTLDEAATAVVDGGGDGGIDAIFYSTSTQILWVVQAKYHQNGRGEPALGDVAKFKTGLENLLQGNYTAFANNSSWQRVLPQIQGVLGYNGGLQVRAVLVYSGINLVSEDRLRMFEDLRTRFSADSDYLQWQSCNLSTIHDWLVGADQSPGVSEVELQLLKPGWVTQPYETVYGLMPLSNLAALFRLHGRRLIAANIRAFKGDTEVNEQIATTVRDEPHHFFYLNNGLTAYCDRLEVYSTDRADTEQKRLRAFGFSIVNGAQTLGVITNAGVTMPTGNVFVKVISLERCLEEREFAERITRSTNFQNQIGPRDFVALDEQQERLAQQLVLEGVIYHYKEGADTPPTDAHNFTLEEATDACATLVNGSDCEFCARLQTNRRSFWSFEEVYPATLGPYRSRYARVFRPELSARTVWRAVQTLRLVKEALKTTETGSRKDFFDTCRWLVLDIVFSRLHPERGNQLLLTPAEQQDVSTKAVSFAEELWNAALVQRLAVVVPGGYQAPRHFRSVFSSATDCQSLRNAAMARINNPASPTI